MKRVRGRSDRSDQGVEPGRDAELEKLHELMARADPAMEQLNNLYNQYFAGAERRPPIERRQQLNQLMDTLFMMTKPTQAIRFKCGALRAKYLSLTERWDRIMKKLEAGKRRRGGD